MNECLHCSKVFEPKRPTRKFCSDSCRVMYNRKHGKRDEIKPFQMQVMYNQLLELVSQLKLTPETKVFDSSPQPKNYFQDEQKQKPKIKIRRSFENYQQLRRDCENDEDWFSLKEEILNSDLSSKQKTLLTN